MATRTTTQGNEQSNAALSVLIQQLMAGGTQEQQRQAAARQGEVNTNQALRARYSPEAALADAQGLMAQQLRKAMESALPTITRSAEGAGASANSMRALLTQDALTRAAESSSALGVNAVQGYGQIGSSISGILEGLTRTDNSSMTALLQALELMQQGTKEEVDAGGSSGGGSGGGRSVTGGSGSGMPSTDNFFYRPGGILANAAATRAQAPTSFGPSVNDSVIADRIIAGLGPSQSLSSVPNINELYRSGFSF